MKNKINLLPLSLLILLALSFNSCKKESDLKQIDHEMSSMELVALGSCTIPGNLQEAVDKYSDGPKLWWAPGSEDEQKRQQEHRQELRAAMAKLSEGTDCENNLKLAYEAANKVLKDRGLPTIENPTNIVAKKKRLGQELSGILNPGDSFKFSDNVPVNAPKFNSVQEFQNSLKEVQFDMQEIGADSILTAKIRYGLGGMGINVYLKTTLDNNNVAKLTNVTSEQWGMSLAWTWQQTEYGQATLADVTSVSVIGSTKYLVYIESFGAIFTSPKTYLIKYNNKTRRLISVSQTAGSRYF